MVKRYVVDFETSNSQHNIESKQTYVWLVGMCEVGNTLNFKTFSSISEWMEYCNLNGVSFCYFHNLDFDGSFIIDFFKNIKSSYSSKFEGKLAKYTFSNSLFSKTPGVVSLVMNGSDIYCIQINWHNSGRMTIYDSAKIVRDSISHLGTELGVPKLHMEYSLDRDDYKITSEDIKYVEHDVVIAARAMELALKYGLKDMTIGSCALRDFTKRVGKLELQSRYPGLSEDQDKFCRKAYRGGWCYLNPRYKDAKLPAGYHLDIHSMYPYILLNKALPYGEPIPVDVSSMALGIQNITMEPDEVYIADVYVMAEVKKGHLPCIRPNNEPEYPEILERTSITLTSVDIEQLFKHYDVSILEFNKVYKFKTKLYTEFAEYVNYWFRVKQNKKTKIIGKMMMNNLIGKFGSKLVNFKSVVVDNNSPDFNYELAEIKSFSYVPLAAFVNAYGRQLITDIANEHADQFIYSDTDSLFLIGNIEQFKSEFITIGDDIGQLGKEHIFESAVFLKTKTYLLYTDNKYVATVAGYPLRDQFTVDEEGNEVSVFNYSNFIDGHTFYVSASQRVDGGRVIVKIPKKL